MCSSYSASRRIGKTNHFRKPARQQTAAAAALSDNLDVSHSSVGQPQSLYSLREGRKVHRVVIKSARLLTSSSSPLSALLCEYVRKKLKQKLGFLLFNLKNIVFRYFVKINFRGPFDHRNVKFLPLFAEKSTQRTSDGDHLYNHVEFESKDAIFKSYQRMKVTGSVNIFTSLTIRKCHLHVKH